MNQTERACGSCGGGKGTIPRPVPRPPRPVTLPRPKR
jgi:hypothetical protein